MSDKIALNIEKAVWDRFERLSKQKKEDPNALMETVLTTYLNNEETDEGAECNVNWLGFGSIEPC